MNLRSDFLEQLKHFQFSYREHIGWARVCVENKISIPEKFRSKFYDELVTEDQVEKKLLENAINRHGVKWSK
jgi:hypothetical protein